MMHPLSSEHVSKTLAVSRIKQETMRIAEGLPFECPCLCVYAASCHATGLEHFCLDGNKKVTDASMPTVGRLLQELTFIDVRHTRITQVGLAWLQQLPLLRSVCTCKCNVTNPKIRQWSAWDNACYEWECRNRPGAS